MPNDLQFGGQKLEDGSDSRANERHYVCSGERAAVRAWVVGTWNQPIESASARSGCRFLPQCWRARALPFTPQIAIAGFSRQQSMRPRSQKMSAILRMHLTVSV